MRCIADLIFGGVCHRFPDLKLVSVESGVGWIPAALETFDWQWRNGGVRDEHPEYDLLPSEYFRRQIYGCFWFEQQARARRDRAVPRQHPVRDRLPAPDVPAPRAAHARRSDRATTRSDAARRPARRRRCARCCTTTPPRSTASRDRRPSWKPPTSGARTSSPTSTTGCCTCASTASSGATRSPRTCTAASSAPRSGPTAQSELDAVCLTGTDDWFGAGGDMAGRTEDPEGLAAEWDAHRPLPVPPHRALPEALGGEDQRRLPSPAGSTSPCTAT